jgi:hypothetical protein
MSSVTVRLVPAGLQAPVPEESNWSTLGCAASTTKKVFAPSRATQDEPLPAVMALRTEANGASSSTEMSPFSNR